MSISEIARLAEEDHHRLKATIAVLNLEISAEPPDNFASWKLALLRALRDFHNQLQKHFDLEEEGGFMDEIVGHAPHFHARVQRLTDEHEEVLITLESILAEFKQIDSPSIWRGSTLKERLLALFELLREHEEAENSLLQETYFHDLGVGG